MHDTDLTVTAKAIFCFIAAYAGKQKTAFPKVSTITKYLGISTSTYYKHFQQLKDKGYITVCQLRNSKNKYQACLYTLNYSSFNSACNDGNSKNSASYCSIPNSVSDKNQYTEIPCTEIPYTENYNTVYKNNNNNINKNSDYNNHSINSFFVDETIIDKIKNQIEFDYFEEVKADKLTIVNMLAMGIARAIAMNRVKVNDVYLSGKALQRFIDNIDSDTIINFLQHLQKAKPKGIIRNEMSYYTQAFFNFAYNLQLSISAISG